MNLAVAPIFQDNMVLQCDLQVPVWGRAAPGAKVSVEFAGQIQPAVSDDTGRWCATLAPLKASAKPAAMTIKGEREIVIRNILVGEVWLASGQSNMGMSLDRANNSAEEIGGANYPDIRFIVLKTKWNKLPSDNLSGNWQACAPKTAGKFSATAYFFARELHRRLGVPVGIVQSAWGGTPAESWTPLESLKARPGLYAALLALSDKFAPFSETEIAQMRSAAEVAERHQDTGNEGEAKGWAQAGADLSEWQPIQVPGYLESVFGEVDGAYWFRRDIELPAAWARSELTLRLGAVDDLDTTYFNGVKIGATGFEVPEWWGFQRVYKIPARLVNPGKNTLAVRVFDERNAGGLPGPEIQLVKPGEPPIDLAGRWKIREERRLAPLPPAVFQHLPHIPAFLFNGMMAPLIPFAIRGAIWYQGENNAARFAEYRTLFKDMISAWREKWGQGDFPFFFVQLPNYKARQPQPAESNWAALREAQDLALSLPNTGMAVAIDIGDEKDIHPGNKQDVGWRLALNALAKVYSRSCDFSGPRFKAMAIEGSKIRLTFEHAAGLKARGKTLKGFAVCGADRHFVWADAVIAGPDVIVWNTSVTAPVAVRYAWADNPECNLVNGANLPAAPFRTDDFDLIPPVTK